jgi:hypothetical protein
MRLWRPDKRIVVPRLLPPREFRRQSGLVRCPRWPGGAAQCNVTFYGAGAFARFYHVTSVEVPLPGGFETNDVGLLLFHNSAGGTAGTISGWTSLFGGTGWALLYRQLVSSDTNPEISGLSATTSAGGAMIAVWRGCSTTVGPVGACSSTFSQNSGSGDLVSCSAITTQRNGSKVVLLVYANATNNTNLEDCTWSSISVGSATATQEAWNYSTAAQSPYPGAMVADCAQASAGSSGSGSATASDITYAGMYAVLAELFTS